MLRSQTRCAGFSLVEVVVVLAVIGTLAALSAGAVQRVREAASRAGCTNHLRQLGIGLAHYESTHRQFPPGVSLEGDGPSTTYPYMGWEARLLPYVEQEALWLKAVSAYAAKPNDFSQSPPHPIDVVVATFTCPADYRTSTSQLARKQVRAALTSYLGVAGITSRSKKGVLFVNSAVRASDVTDGLSNTLAVGERPPSSDFWYGWWYAGFGVSGTGSADMVLGVRDRVPTSDPLVGDCPSNPMPYALGSLDKLCDAFHYWSLHPGGAHFLFADGSVHFLRYDAAPLLPALATRAGGEPAPTWE